ncbi:uncharacterized protein LOC134531069 [Bacillus rossius redtenbacheri]|uniref:uncharacterized protein LOC134531069 n=1 Tax=Bacillus rossius redtenbacheri TaxID=93214 RepID=UPI002FDD1CB1
MERDIICEGFNCSIEMHGIMYKHYIGDGDAAVMSAIQQTCNYGRYVTKVECANHATRAFSEKIHKLASNTTYSLEGRKLLLQTDDVNKISRSERLVKGTRTAIKESAQKQGTDAIEILRQDLRNVPDHVFGNHKNCRSTFCKRKESGEKNLLPDLEKAGLLQPIRNLMANLEKKADKLVTNSTTNAAERYMALNAKFTGGKRINFGKRGSYYRRCYGAAIAHSCGPGWHTSPWKKMHGRSPGSACKKMCNRRERKSSKRKLNYQENGAPKKKRKTGGGPDRHYGNEELMLDPDVSEEEMISRCDQLLLKVKEEAESKEKRDCVEIATRGQHDNEKWYEYRMNRLTASNFGTVILRRDYTPCHNLVRNLLFPKELNTASVMYGRVHEPEALSRYSSEKGVVVNRCGLFIYENLPFLAATPDGIVDEELLVEVKCLPSVKDRKLWDVAEDKSASICLEIKNGKLSLKRNHRFYYQVQGQLNITGRELCDFVIATPKDFYIERIEKDEFFWKNTMLPKLEKFYLQCMLPEIVDSRIKRNLKVRDPLYIIQAQEKFRNKKTSAK